MRIFYKIKEFRCNTLKKYCPLFTSFFLKKILQIDPIDIENK